MSRKQRAIVWFLVLAVGVPGLASAGRRGRLIGKVVDPEGTPIEGVTVTATSPDLSSFNEVRITDKKGAFILDFDTISVTYRYRFQKAGYQTFDAEQNWSLEGTERHEFVMHPGGAATVGDLAPTSSSEPAVRAYNAAAAAFEAKSYAAAQVKFEEAVEYDPLLRPAWAGLTLAHFGQGHYQEAVETAEKAMALGATDELTLRCRWEAYRQLGDEAKTAAALADLERYGRATVEATKVYNEAVALVKAGDHEGAFARFQEAVTIDPQLEEALLGVATQGLHIKRYQEALDAAEAILEDDPGHEQALRARFNAALGLGDESVLVPAAMGLATVEPIIARDALLHLAYNAYDASDMARAKELFGKVLEVDPTQPQTHYVLALIAVNDGATEEAKQHLERFLELAPDSPEAATARDLLDYLSGP
jgi:tetratricopeptide (TPR) repeat protein